VTLSGKSCHSNLIGPDGAEPHVIVRADTGSADNLHPLLVGVVAHEAKYLSGLVGWDTEVELSIGILAQPPPGDVVTVSLEGRGGGSRRGGRSSDRWMVGLDEDIGGVEEALDQILSLTSERGVQANLCLCDGDDARTEHFQGDHVLPLVEGAGEGIRKARECIPNLVLSFDGYHIHVLRPPVDEHLTGLIVMVILRRITSHSTWYTLRRGEVGMALIGSGVEAPVDGEGRARPGVTPGLNAPADVWLGAGPDHPGVIITPEINVTRFTIILRFHDNATVRD